MKTEKTFEDLQQELSEEDNEIIDNYIHRFEQAKNEAQNRVEYAKKFKENVLQFFSVLDCFTPKNPTDMKLMLTLADKIKNHYGSK